MASIQGRATGVPVGRHIRQPYVKKGT